VVRLVVGWVVLVDGVGSEVREVGLVTLVRDVVGTEGDPGLVEVVGVGDGVEELEGAEVCVGIGLLVLVVLDILNDQEIFLCRRDMLAVGGRKDSWRVY
jgi:hypothetical protein